MEIRQPTSYQPCAQCEAPCCKQYRVSILGYDAWRISRGLQMQWHEFIWSVVEKEVSPNGYLLKPDDDTTYDLFLHKVPPKAKRKNEEVQITGKEACVFLMQLPGGFGRCGIYEHRPLVCSAYPISIAMNGLHIRENLPCPTNGWNLSLLDLPLWRERALQIKVEQAIYHYIVASWNARMRNGQALFYLAKGLNYFVYCHHLYDKLLAVRESYSPEAWSEIKSYWLSDFARDFTSIPAVKEALDELSPLPLYSAPYPSEPWLKFIYTVAATVVSQPFVPHNTITHWMD